MAAKQVMLAVSKETREKMRALARRLEAISVSGGRHPIPVAGEIINPAGCTVTMDALINYLIECWLKNQRRADEQKIRRRGKREG